MQQAQPGQPQGCPGIVLLQRRQQPVAHPVARHAQGPVGRIVHGSEPRRGHGGQQIRPRQPQEGAHHRAVDRPDPRQPFEAAAEEEPEEHGLRLIVPVVGGGDPAGAERLARPFQEGVARPAAGRLGALAGETGADVGALADAGDPQPLRDPGRRVRPGAGAGIHGMIEVGGGEPEPAVRREAGHPPEEGGRIGATGEGDEDALARGERRLVAEEGLQDVEEIHGRRRMVAVTGLEPMT